MLLGWNITEPRKQANYAMPDIGSREISSVSPSKKKRHINLKNYLCVKIPSQEPKMPVEGL